MGHAGQPVTGCWATTIGGAGAAGATTTFVSVTSAGGWTWVTVDGGTVDGREVVGFGEGVVGCGVLVVGLAEVVVGFGLVVVGTAEVVDGGMLAAAGFAAGSAAASVVPTMATAAARAAPAARPVRTVCADSRRFTLLPDGLP